MLAPSVFAVVSGRIAVGCGGSTVRDRFGHSQIEDQTRDGPFGFDQIARGSDQEPLTQSWSGTDDAGMADDRCVHDLLVGQCAECAAVPAGLTRRVFRTSGGTVFHRSVGCQGLIDGQRFAKAVGKSTHPAVGVPVGEALADGLGACLVCFPRYRPAAAGSTPCLVLVEGQWRSGTVLRWQRTPDQRWSALVSCSVDGDLRSFVETQENLRPRG